MSNILADNGSWRNVLYTSYKTCAPSTSTEVVYQLMRVEDTDLIGMFGRKTNSNVADHTKP